MNFLYYKGFSDDKACSSHGTYKKKKDPRKKGNLQHGIEGGPPLHPLKRHSGCRPYTPPSPGHVLGCDCELCSVEFPLRTHLLLDMSYARLSGAGLEPMPKISLSSTGGGGFSKIHKFFRRKKAQEATTAMQTSTALALLQEQRRLTAIREQEEHKAREAEERAAAQCLDAVTLATLKQDSLMIPRARMAHFYPAGHPIPCGVKQGGKTRVLEAADQSPHVVFHMLGPAEPVSAALTAPLTDLYHTQRVTLLKAFKSAVAVVGGGTGGGVLQGMVLLNLERGGEMGKVEFPFMVVWVVEARGTSSTSALEVVRKLRETTLAAFDPAITGFTCTHSFRLHEEVAMLARPPIEKVSRKATTPTTGYIITVFKVFEGDDSVKFERNWLGWSGARTLYKSLSGEVGLRRVTLHKSEAQEGLLHYLLVCDCAHFLTRLHHAVRAIPSLRMRLCGDMGLYRPIATF